MNITVSKCDFVKQALKEKVTEGKYRPGDKIPTEPEIVKTYGVGRNTVREAISSLVHEGVLEKIQGKGTFVNKIKKRGDTTRELASSITIKELSQLYDVRSVLEGLAGRLACDNFTERDIEELQDSARKHTESWKKKDLSAARSADMHFHNKIVDLSRNIFLQKQLKEFFFIKRFFLLHKTLINETQKNVLLDENGPSHELIAETIKKRNKDECEAMLRQHIQRSKLNLFEQIMGVKLNPF